MEQLLNKFKGTKVDISCGGSAILRGEVIDVGDGVVHMKDEEGQQFYVALQKISVVSECSPDHIRPGFII